MLKIDPAEPIARQHHAHVIVTGALGNVGFKVLEHLATRGRTKHLIGMDCESPTEEQAKRAHAAAAAGGCQLEFVQCDLTQFDDQSWQRHFETASAVLHFAAKLPVPESGWDAAQASLVMTHNTALAAARSQSIRRYVFASSNHVMGGYKGRGLGAGELTADLMPAVGTVWHTGEDERNSTAYATARWAGEHLCRSLAEQQPQPKAPTTYVCVRIGWTQPGANLPQTISATGTPRARTTEGLETLDQRTAAADLWFKHMWLSNRDCCDLFERALEADVSTWPSRCVIVNGVSANRGTPWSQVESRQYLGFVAQDDVFDADQQNASPQS